MKRKLLTFFICAVVLAAACAMFGIVQAQEDAIIADGGCGGFGNTTRWQVTESGILRIYGSGETGEMQGTPPWDRYSNSITKIEIAEGVTSIGINFFKGLTKVTEVSMADSVVDFRPSAFSSFLTNLPKENGVYYADKWAVGFDGSTTVLSLREDTIGIGEQFITDQKLTSISIPASVIHLSGGAFPVSLLEYENGAYYVDKWLVAGDRDTWNISVRDDTVGIAQSAFSNHRSISTLTIPDSCKKIGYRAFRLCTELRTLVLPKEVSYMGSEVFVSCGKLTEIAIPEGVTAIDGEAFKGCKGLTKVALPTSVTSIGASAFEDCAALAEINITDAITGIGDAAFSGCRSLTEVYIPKSFTSLNSKVFYNCSSLKSITLPEGLLAINPDAFYGCSALTEIKLPDTLTFIGSYAFGSCTGLTEITIPDSVTSIGTRAFDKCNDLVENEDGVLYIGKWAVGRDSVAATVTVRDGTVGLADETFRGIMTGLESVTLPNTLRSIGTAAFRECNKLSKVVIPNSVVSIEYMAFYNCKNLSTMIYCGTEAEWDAIVKGQYWSNQVPAKVSYHSFEAWESVDENTHRQICAICGEASEKTENHKFSSGTVTGKPTHANPGEMTYTCRTCGKEKTEPIAPAAHEYGAWAEHDDTQHKKSCDCGDVVYEDHNWDAGAERTPATHLGDGERVYTCTDCGAEKTEPIDKIPHSYGDWTKHDAAQHKKVCDCGDTVYEDHDWDDGEITAEPSETAEGERTYTCTVCTATKTEPIEKLPSSGGNASGGDGSNGDGSNGGGNDSPASSGCGGHIDAGSYLLMLLAVIGVAVFSKKRTAR